jgi:hypothetical protein
MRPARCVGSGARIIAAYYERVNASHPRNGGLWQFDAISRDLDRAAGDGFLVTLS